MMFFSNYSGIVYSHSCESIALSVYVTLPVNRGSSIQFLFRSKYVKEEAKVMTLEAVIFSNEQFRMTLMLL